MKYSYDMPVYNTTAVFVVTYVTLLVSMVTNNKQVGNNYVMYTKWMFYFLPDSITNTSK